MIAGGLFLIIGKEALRLLQPLLSLFRQACLLWEETNCNYKKTRRPELLGRRVLNTKIEYLFAAVACASSTAGLASSAARRSAF